jgi:hypothetical protein
VAYVLYWREFASPTLQALRGHAGSLTPCKAATTASGDEGVFGQAGEYPSPGFPKRE